MITHELFDRPIAFHRPFVRLGAGVTGALMLSQAIYWSRRTRDADGWFYKTQEEWEEETGLTRCEQETARRKLIKAGVMEELKKGVPCRLFYRVDTDTILEILLAGSQQSSLRETSKLACGKPAGKEAVNQHAITETTAETSTEITSVGAASRTRAKFDPLTAKPDNVSAEAWGEWCEFRSEIKKKLTPMMCKQQGRALAGHANPDAVIRLSVGNGWTGLFPDKVTAAAPSSRHHGFADRDYKAGLTEREDGSYAF